MKIINNRGFAFAVCVLAAVISIFGLGGGKLSRLRNEAENAFFDGNNGYSAYQDLMERREYAANLLQIAQQTIPEEEVYQSAAEAFDSFTASETPEEYYETNGALQAAIDELYQALSQAGMEPRHIEGKSTTWILLDYGELVVHVFYKEARDFYQLERLWVDGVKVDLTEIIEE